MGGFTSEKATEAAVTAVTAVTAVETVSTTFLRIVPDVIP